MRGVGNDRAVNFFQDTSVAFYVDGVYTDQSYSTDSMFDMERVEVARGPQGTTGGKAAIAGSISLWSRKPTDTFDMRGERGDYRYLDAAVAGRLWRTDWGIRVQLSSGSQLLYR